jgi:hypothetical protein
MKIVSYPIFYLFDNKIKYNVYVYVYILCDCLFVQETIRARVAQ